MKKLYSLLTIAFISYGINAQCPTGEISFTTQMQVDNFIVQYPNCTAINGDINISGNNITQLNGLANIVSVSGDLEIRDNRSLVTLTGLERLTTVGGDFEIRENEELMNIAALSALTSVGGDFELRECSFINSVQGLQNLTTVGGDFIIRENDNLQSLQFLSGLTTVGGEFAIRSCPDLTNLYFLNNLTTIGLSLIIRDNERLINLNALSSITFVGETLEITENPALVSISGLSNITTILGGDEGSILIEDNPLLTTLTGLGNANTQITGDVTIRSNNLLALCAVPSICNYLENVPAGDVVRITSNIMGCNSRAQVEAACSTMTTDYFDADKNYFTLLKNPVQNELQLHSSLATNGTVTVYDALGKKVAENIVKHGVNTYPFAVTAGVYFVQIHANGQTVFKKVVKQ